MSNIKCKYGCKNGKVFMPKLGEFIDCPEHSVKNLDMDKIKIKEEVSLGDALLIPEQYRGLSPVDRSLFTRSVLDAYSSSSLEQLGKLLEKINKNLYNGVVPKLSCYIHSPSLIDIKQFIYASQKLALEKGLSVVPFISANRLFEVQSMVDFSLSSLAEIDKILNVKNKSFFNKNSVDLLNYAKEMNGSSLLDRADNSLKAFSTDMINAVEGYRLLKDTGLTYSDYIRADLCYIYAGANTKPSGFTAIADILAERSMKNLPTFVFGYWSSTAGKTSEILRYLLARDGISRLDLLVPYDLVYKSSKDSVKFNKDLDKVGTTKSDLVGGYKLY